MFRGTRRAAQEDALMWITLHYEVDTLPEDFMDMLIAQSVGYLYRDQNGMICAQPKGWRRQSHSGKGRKGKGRGWRG